MTFTYGKPLEFPLAEGHVLHACPFYYASVTPLTEPFAQRRMGVLILNNAIMLLTRHIRDANRLFACCIINAHSRVPEKTNRRGIQGFEVKGSSCVFCAMLRQLLTFDHATSSKDDFSTIGFFWGI